MLTLQKSFSYQGDVHLSPFSRLKLAVQFPIFDYIRLEQRELSVTRNIAGTDHISIEQELNNQAYHIDLPYRALTGDEQETVINFLIYTAKAIADKNIQKLSFSIPVEYITESGVISTNSFEAIYSIKNTRELFGEFRMVDRATKTQDIPKVINFLQNHIYLLNQEAYNKLTLDFQNLTGKNDNWLLFLIVTQLLDEAELDPTRLEALNEFALRALISILQTQNIERQDEVIAFIKENIGNLFDFPIAVPEIKTLEIAGQFEVRTADNQPITVNELQFYDLSFEYEERRSTAAIPKIVHYDWKRSSDALNNNEIPFSFPEAKKIVISSVSDLITIRVKAFDGTVLWNKVFQVSDPELKQVSIIISELLPAKLTVTKPTAIVGIGKKLRGQVLEMTKKCSLKDLTVIIQAKKHGDNLWRVVAATNTDASGNFSVAYPYGDYVQAQALVSLMPDTPADIGVKNGGPQNETIADDFLYLLVTSSGCEDDQDDEDCDCDKPKKAPRLPDQTDLIHSDEYTQDIGGSCINLSTPNRTLSEFSYSGIVRTSDPDVANYTLRKITPSRLKSISAKTVTLISTASPLFEPEKPDIETRFELVPAKGKITRQPIDLDNPIRWQDAPDDQENLSFYQAVTIATGHVLHYRAEFKADGYSLGDLLYSLALAPGQKKQIVVMDSAHTLQGAETQNISQGESLAASLLNERDILNQLGGNINEALRGSSSASTGGVSAGLGIGATLGVVSGALGVAGGYSSSSASASQDSSRNTALSFGEKLRQRITQNAQSYRQLNATVVTGVQEGQQYSVTTDVVANHNHCHALTMMYFEVLRHYAIYQELVSVEECIFVPLLMTNFTVDNIYKWADILGRNLLHLSSNTYLQPYSFLRYRVTHPLLPAFDANERIKTKYAHVDFPDGAYSDEKITSVTGHMTIRVNIPRPKTVYDRILSFPIVKREETHNKNGGGIFGAIADAVIGKRNVSTEWLERVKFVDAHILIYDNFQEAHPADVIEVINFNEFFDDGTPDQRKWIAIANLCGYTNVQAFLERYFSHKTISQWDSVYNEEIAPRIFEALVDNTISIEPFSAIDFTILGEYNGGERLMRLNLRCDISSPRKKIAEVVIKYANNVLFATDFFSKGLKFAVENLTVNYTTKHYEGFIINKYVGDDLYENPPTPMEIHLDTPMNSDEQRDPKKEDKYLALKLIEHLNSNLEHYNKALWYNLDPDRRYMLLDGFNIEIYNDFGVSIGSRSLASVVKNELLTITGNSLVFPVAAGYKVSQSYVAETDQQGEQQNVSLFEHYKPYTPIPPYRISVPSKGVFLEAVQGQCDACERVKENSSQDWTKFTTEEPTPIVPVTTPVPTITDWKAAFKDFAPPLINIQNAPALPEPGAGVSNLTELLGKSGIFKDVTGLDATQQNVIRTYLSNQENAKAFAEMAKTMALQEHNTQHSDKIMDSLKTAKDSGAIGQEDYGKLVKDHLQKQIDGGEAQNQQAAQQSKQLQASPIKSAVELAQKGNNVSATETDSEGNMKSLVVESKEGLEQQNTFVIPGTIIALKQSSPNACWATVTTMMSNWKKQLNQTVEEYINSVSSEFLSYIETGIPIEKLNEFCSAAGLRMAHTNTEYPVSFYYDILKKNGPIWMIDLENSDPTKLHGRLLIGIAGNGTNDSTKFKIIDPATGNQYEETLSIFVSKTENVIKTIDAIDDIQIPLLIFFKDAYDNTIMNKVSNSNVSIGSGQDNQTRVREFVPTNENTLVVNGVEGSSVPNLTNWRGLYKNPDGSFPLPNPKMRADRMFDDKYNPGNRKYCGEGYREPAKLNKLLLHETAGFNDYKTVSQFEIAGYPHNNPTSSYKPMPHFCVNRDGSIIQFLDVCELVNHGEALNPTSIGIEFVNHPWGAEDMSQNGNEIHGITPLQIPAIPTRPSLNNHRQKTCLYIPNQVQLEALVTLLNALLAHPALSSLRQNWMNVININPMKFATEKLDDLKAYFIINNAAVYLKDNRFTGINSNMSSEGWSIAPPGVPGIYSHALYAHSDGMTQSFYAWLRIAQKMNPSDAMTTFKAYIASVDSRVDGGNNVALIDISKIVFATG